MLVVPTFILEFDGGSRGNPGPAGIGVVIRLGEVPLVTLGQFIGRATNNVAEYKALITGMRKARELEIENLNIFGDSELVVRQMLGEYRVRNATLRPLFDEARTLFQQFKNATIRHNYRSHNHLADKLANKAMDIKGEVTEI